GRFWHLSDLTPREDSAAGSNSWLGRCLGVPSPNRSRMFPTSADLKCDRNRVYPISVVGEGQGGGRLAIPTALRSFSIATRLRHHKFCAFELPSVECGICDTPLLTPP